MVGDDQRHTVKAVHVAPEFSDRQLRLQQSLRSERPKSKDCFWSYEFKLSQEVRSARSNLVGHRIPVSRRPVLQNVTDKNVPSLQIDGGENLCEQLAGGADKWKSLLVLGCARRFADDHELSVCASRAGHRIGRGRVERATRARRDGSCHRVERIELCQRATEELAVVGADDDAGGGKRDARCGKRI